VQGFEIVRSVGRGTTAEVFEARDAHGRTVAVKVFPPDSRSMRWHAWSEAEQLAKLDHPSILKIHEFGEDEGKPYIAMEFVNGPSLERRILEQGAFFQEDAVRMVRKIAEGLAYAHSMGVFHGDVRPRNVLLRNGDPLHPVLCDFGLNSTGSKAADIPALAEILRFAAGSHPLADRLRVTSIELAISEIDRFLAGEPMTRVLKRRRGCLGF